MHTFHDNRLRSLSGFLITFFIASFSLVVLFSVIGPANPIGRLAVQPAQAASPRILYVKPNPDGTANCLTWTSACSLSTALAQTIAPDGNEIWVMKGVYRLENRIQLKNKVALYGGFAGNESSRTQRNFAANVTVLSGDADGDDISDANGVVTTSLHISGTNLANVIFSSNVTNTAVLDGFTITAGDNHNYGYGGGGLCSNGNSNPTLANLIFSGNASTQEGGGMYNYNNSHPTLTNVTFSGNSASSGGGLYNDYNSNPTLTNVTFSGNSASSGGGMYNSNNSNPALSGVSFTNNTASSGGGLYNQSTLTLNKATFTGNAATGNGGGMYNQNGNATLNNATFNGNSANNYGGGLYNYASSNYTLILTASTFNNNWAAYGGGMYNYYGPMTLSSTTFSKNWATNGGAIYASNSTQTLTDITFNSNSADSVGGGMYNYGSNSVLTNVKFSDNAATSNGGGMYNQSSAVKLTNATLSGNSAANGGGIYNQSSSPVLTNITVYGNVATSGCGMYNQSGSTPTLTNAILWGNLTGGDPPIYNGGGTAAIYYSLIEGGCPAGSNCDSHILDTDPLFVDAANGNLHLKANSPAIDAGDNATAGLTDITTDLDGNARFTNDLTIADTGNGTAPIVDLGAYEYEPKLPTTTSLKASPNPARLGQTITFVATVTAGTGTPSGNVTFFNGTTQLGSSNLNSSGVASLTSAVLPVGTHSITARYNGNTNLLASTSNAVSQVVIPNTIYLPLALRNFTPYFGGPWESEPNNDYQHANGPLRFGQTYFAYPNDAKDYFSFYLPKANTLTVEMTGHTGGGVQMLLYYKTPVANGEVRRIYGAPYTITYPGAAGWYYVYIFAASDYNSNDSYTLKITVPASTSADESLAP